MGKKVAVAIVTAVASVKEAIVHGARLAQGKMIAAMNGSRIIGEITAINGDELRILAFQPKAQIVTLKRSDVIVKQVSAREYLDCFASLPKEAVGEATWNIISKLAADETLTSKEKCQNIGATLFGANWIRADYKLGDVPYVKRGDAWIILETKPERKRKRSK